MERRFTRPRALTRARMAAQCALWALMWEWAEWLSQSMFVEELRRQFHAEHNEYIADLTAAIESAKDIHGKAIRSRPGTRGSHLRRVLQPCGSRSPKTRPNR